MSNGRLRTLAWGSATVVVCLVAGLLLGTTRGVSDGTELRASDSPRLSDLVRVAQSESDDLAASRDALATQVARLQSGAATNDDEVAAVLDQLAELEDPAGLTEQQAPASPSH